MSDIVRWRPLSGLSSLQGEMNEAFDRFFGRPIDLASPLAPGVTWIPAANVAETGDSIVVTMEMPGIQAKEVDVSVTGDTLTVRGEKRDDREEKEASWHRVERSYGSFTRSFRLPASVVLDKVSADCKDGVLRIVLPKSDESRKREVKIKVE